jgi:alkanesulfonate monooxygenase SsuD/methylene tetrahydromethanopterin reductase-like flavin-dependent oxidoreductase (luciferase family)
MAVNGLGIAKMNTDEGFPLNIDFGWEMPSGNRRMPLGAENYKPYVCRILDHIKDHFHSAWMPDHFMNRSQDDYQESLISIGYLAALYPQLYFGPVVLGQNYRPPALLAKMAATLQQLTGGRFILGIGAGWRAEEYRAYGYDFPPAPVRMAQLAEVVQICQAMWDPAQPEATFHGDHHHIDQAVSNPKPSPAPPVMIGGAGEKLMLRVVAQYADWWNLVGVSPETYAHKIQVLHRHCADVGRDPADIRKTWMGVVSLAPTRQQAEAAMRHYPIWPGDVPIVGTPSEVVVRLQDYTALGVDLFILAFADEPQLTGIDLFIDEVMPYIIADKEK